MKRLTINKLGPIESCLIDCSSFMTFTGAQASGKSTVAKAIYYFRSANEELFDLIEKRALSDENFDAVTLKKQFTDHLREKFLRVFGSSWGMDNFMKIKFEYSETAYISVSLVEDNLFSAPNYVWIDLSPDIKDMMKKYTSYKCTEILGIPDEEKRKIKSEINRVFQDEEEVVYIPAGRSMLTLLSQQLNYIYTTMKDSQKRMLDYCTQDYIERILQLKPEFANGLEGVVAYYGEAKDMKTGCIKDALNLAKEVLKGKYRFSDNEERIVLDNEKYVKVNFASSGQQEAVWILNLLFYYLLRKKPVLFIIEEPESHLFPESQKYITELISLVKNQGNSVVLTTHSPYVLGTLNNLLFASQIPVSKVENASAIIPNNVWLDPKTTTAWFVKNGGVETCIDEEIHLIQNERIDEISKSINEDFDSLFEMIQGE